MRKFFLVLIFLSLSASAFSQKATLRHFGLAEGLPSLAVFSIHLDEKGYLWAGTPEGLVKYDGDRFELIPGYHEPGKFIMRIWDGSDGKIWFQAAEAKTFYYDGDSIYPFHGNHTIEEFLETGNNHSVNSAVLDGKGTLHIGFNGLGHLQIDSAGNFNAVNLENSPPGYFLEEIEGQLLDYGINKKGGYPFDPPLLKIDFGALHFEYNYDFDDRFQMIFLRTSKRLSDGRILVVTGNHVLEVFPDGKYKEHFFPRVIYQIAETKDGRLIISYLLGGMEVFSPDFQPLSVRFPQLDGNRMGRVISDRQGGYWIKGSNQGLFHLQSLDILRFGEAGKTKANQIITICQDHQGGIFYGSADGKIYFISAENELETFATLPPDGSMGTFIQTMTFDTLTQTLLLSSETNNLKCKGGKFEVLTQTGEMDRFARIVDLGNGEFIGVNAWEIMPFPHGTVSDWPKIEYANFAALPGAVKGKGREIWFVSRDSLYHCTPEGVENIALPETNSQMIIESIHPDGEGNLLIGGGGAGLLLVEGEKMHWIGEEAGLSGFTRGGFRLENGDIWAVQREGLVRLRENEKGEFQIKKLGREQGLLSLGIEGAIYDGKYLWLADPEGFLRVNPEKVKFDFPPAPLYIVKAQTPDSVYKTIPQILDRNQNTITFHFRSLNFRQAGNLTYQYKLEGLENEWVEAPTNQVRFSKLSPGKYTFSVRAGNGQGVWGEPKNQTFRILPAFWETTWFFVLCVLLSLALLFAIFFLVLARIRRANQMREQNLLFEQQALNAQMNPHFVFNSLNSIQAFIVKQDTRNSIHYLSKFAKLMRTSLDASQMRIISLQEEINLLNNYCELERLRFDGAFEFEIETDPELDRDKIGLPTYFIQPHVENAIWHGLQHLPKEKEGRLKISFWAEGETLNCRIEDNGIGRKASREMKTGSINHQSHAIKIMEKRLNLFRKIHPRAVFDLQFIDLTDEKGKGQGTAVHLKFPIMEVKRSEEA